MRIMAGLLILVEGPFQRIMVLLLLSDLCGELLAAVVPEEIVSHIQRPFVVAATSTAVLHRTEVELGSALAVSAG